MRVLIAGCGYVGAELGAQLVARGHEVFGLRRTLRHDVPAGVEPLVADLLVPAELTAALPDGLDHVVYAASAGGWDDLFYRAAYVDGPRNLLHALAARSDAVRRFVFVSSTGVYTQQGGELVDEDSPAEPNDFSGRRLLEGERVVAGGPFPATVIRLAGIYGPGRTRAIDNVRSGRATISPVPVYTNRIHRDDAAGAIAHLLALDAPAPLYLGVDHEPATDGDVASFIAAALGLPPPPVATGDGGVPERRGNKRCSNARLVASGYTFRYPTYREGFGNALRGDG